MAEKKPTTHYIDKEEFSEEMDIHAKACRAAREKGKQMPKCPDSIGEKFMLIAKNVSTKGNFSRYPFREEMVADAIENMLRYRYNYRKERGHAFSYFTQFTMYAFIRRIKKEKEQLHIKAKHIQSLSLHEFIPHVVMHDDQSTVYRNEYIDYLIGYYEQKLPTIDTKKKKSKKKAVRKTKKEE
jgi:hypothetical protein